jgi:hypothetical protein
MFVRTMLQAYADPDTYVPTPVQALGRPFWLLRAFCANKIRPPAGTDQVLCELWAGIKGSYQGTS